MPDTKNFSLRVKVLDGLLRKREGVTIHEMLQVVNERLEERGICTVRTKDTILSDITEIANEYHVRIMRIRDRDDSRVIRYRYENTDFSIFYSGLTAQQSSELRYSLRLLSRCKGFPELKWVKNLCSSMDVPLNYCQEPVLEFDSSIGKLGKSCFQGLFFAIIEKRTIEITYLEENSLLEKMMMYPYYLKQFSRDWYLVAMLMYEPGLLRLFEVDRIKSYRYHPEQEYKDFEGDVSECFNDIRGMHNKNSHY